MKQQILSAGQNQTNSRAVNKAFYTDFNQKSEIEQQEGRLRKYVDQIEQKIDYAKWKQQLVLKYNYIPIKRITDKIINEKVNYVRKISEQEKMAAKILSGKEITVQLDLFREFSKQLNQKMLTIKSKIAEERINNSLLEKEVQAKRGRLKQKIRENMQNVQSTLEEQGVKNKEDIITLFRSKSMKDRYKPIALTSRTQMPRKISERKVQSQITNRSYRTNTNCLFEDCWNELIKSIGEQKKQSSQTTTKMTWNKFSALKIKQIVKILIDKFKTSQRIKKIILNN